KWQRGDIPDGTIFTFSLRNHVANTYDEYVVDFSFYKRYANNQPEALAKVRINYKGTYISINNYEV
ncbi:hypothetical protein PFISCL1PPCAC_4146, partial [Pristionchus fissidentatus]